jgi:hypothetical protein
VPDNAEVVLSAANREFASFFARVRLKSYADLQLLGFVPRRLAEDKVRQAMATDDEDALRLAAGLQREGDCGCNDARPVLPASRMRGSTLRSVYNRIRKRHNPALARVLSDHYHTLWPWDSPVAAIMRKQVAALNLSTWELLLTVAADITIKSNATLWVGAGVQALLAHNIWIHSTGKLIQQGSYLKLWANSINHFSGSLNLSAVAAASKIGPIWALSE